MATVAALGTTTWNTTAGNKTVTTTPAVNDLIVIVAAASGTSEANAATTAVTDNNSSGTYVKVCDSLNAAAGASPRISVWVRTALIGSATSTVFTATQASSSGGGLRVFAVVGMSRTGLEAVRAAAAAFNASGATTPAVTLWTPALTGNALIAGLVNSSSPAAVTPPTSFTEDPTPDLGYSTPTTGIETARVNSGITAATITWGSTSATAWRAVVVELDTSALSAKVMPAIGVG